MGRRISHVIFSAIILLFSVSCVEIEREREKMVLIYFDGNNNLAQSAEENIDSLLVGYLPSDDRCSDALLVYKHIKGEQPVLSSYNRDKHGEVKQTIISVYPISSVSTSPEMLKRVVSDARTVFPAKSYGLLLWSHGSGWLPPYYHSDPTDQANVLNYLKEDIYPVKGDDLKSFGQDKTIEVNNEMDIKYLASSLTNDYDFILFDCCLMSCVEVAYELRNKCRYIVASPTEIMSKGFPYQEIMEPIFNDSDAAQAMKDVCGIYFNSYLADSSPWATIAMIDTRYLDQLADVSKMIFANHRDAIKSFNANAVQKYDRNTRGWFNDFDDFVHHIANKDEYSQFCSALNRVVVEKYATKEFISIDIEKYCGLSIYIPNSKYSNLNEYYKTLSWNDATGLVM